MQNGHTVIENPERQRSLTEKKLYQLKSLWLYPQQGRSKIIPHWAGRPFDRLVCWNTRLTRLTF